MLYQDLNMRITGASGRPILMDLFYNKTIESAPLIIFCHGYKGFKDWGAWTLLAKTFANSGFAFLKFNFSHNGGSSVQPIDFPNLEAFGHNNYSKELGDLDRVIDWVQTTYAKHPHFRVSNITLLGHSRGGGIVVLKASQDLRIKKVVSLAGVSDFKSRFPVGDELENWKTTGVRFVVNGRTKQQMPHYYQFYRDFIANESRLSIEIAAKALSVPYLIVHGDADTTVSINEALKLQQWQPRSKLLVLNDANHVFGSSHPWKLRELPPCFHQIHSEITDFINN